MLLVPEACQAEPELGCSSLNLQRAYSLKQFGHDGPWCSVLLFYLQDRAVVTLATSLEDLSAMKAASTSHTGRKKGVLLEQLLK